MPTLNLTHHPQRQGSDCLAACTRIILENMGFRVRYRQLLRLLKIQPNSGASFLNLTLLENEYNSVSVTIDWEYDDPLGLLERFLVNNSPVITSVNTVDLPSWQGEATEHAVVVSGITESSVLIYDPWFKSFPQIVDRIQFESAWLHHEFLYATILKRA